MSLRSRVDGVQDRYYIQKTMPASILIKIKPQQESTIEGRGEEALFRLLIEILNPDHPALVRVIQSGKDETPLTLSPFLKGAKFSDKYSYLSPDKMATFRITCLNKDVLEPVMGHFFHLSGTNAAIRLAGKRIVIDKVDMQKSSPAHFISYEQLLEEAPPQSSIIFEYCSPTSFGGLTGDQSFPIPRLVLTSLLKKWNVFSPRKISSDLMNEFERVRIERFNLKTDSVRYGRESTLGFIGTAAYALPPSTDKDKRVSINALANFALFSGVGIKTEKGMGQVRRRMK